MTRSRLAFAVCTGLIAGCSTTEAPTPLSGARTVDLLIVGGTVYSGQAGDTLQAGDVAIDDGHIVFVGNEHDYKADTTLDAGGAIVTAGFIDPHTHSMGDLASADRNSNINYLTQGVTTVFNGNDGGGQPNIGALARDLESRGIGTNVALLVGHGAVRRQIMDGDNRPPTTGELEAMRRLVTQAMRDGAFGLSSGLFYAPGSFAATPEVIALAQAIAPFNGVYDTHLRDESSYNIGLLEAVDEALTIGREAGVAVNFAHIKALGVDVWGLSDAVIERIRAAQASGMTVTADQYPWRASGTQLRATLLPKVLLEGSTGVYRERLRDPQLIAEHRGTMQDNLRRRGGPESLLMVMSDDKAILGKTLAEIAAERQTDPIAAAIEIIIAGPTRVASFNMNQQDIDAFIVQPWVMSSSDGNDGHPRKYASFPKKYQDYVKARPLLTTEDFLYRSSALTADSFGLRDRGRLQAGLVADVIVVDPETFAPAANFDQWDSLSTGVVHAIVNGELVIENREYNGTLAGRVLLKQPVQ